MTLPERQGLEAALRQLDAAATAKDAAPHLWAARVFLEDLAGAEGERPAWLLGRNRLDDARAEIRGALAAALSEASHA